MAVNVQPNGEFQVIYGGPYTGINVQMPENLIADTDTPASNDFIFRNAELRSRPNFNPTFIAAPTAGVISAIGTLNGTLWAVASDTGNLYTYNASTGVWTSKGGLSLSARVRWRQFGGIVYFVDDTSNVSSWNGSAIVSGIAQQSGNTLGAFFIDELDNHLLLINTVENPGSAVHPQRIRWSATGLPAQWDPTVNVNAGFNDFLDVPDSLTGTLMLGRVGYLLRTDGITEIDPTGIGIAPFQFNHLWASQQGVGNINFDVSAQYGLTGVIISRDNVYSLQSFNLQAIGGNARDAILTDLTTANTLPSNLPGKIGVIIPGLLGAPVDGAINNPLNMNKGTLTYTYLTYMLFILQSNSTRVWVYSFDENNWTRFTLPNIRVTGVPFVNAPGSGATANVPTLMIPVQNSQTGVTSIATFDPTNFNDLSQGSSHSYKVEDIIANGVPTVRRVILTYRDLGQATITASITGTNDSGQFVSSPTAVVAIGNASPTGKLITAFVDVALSAFRPQLTINRAAGAGPVSISTATMVGHIEKVML